jgi:class 3 adenylate cyclase/TolB-like protein/Tfp pilus assembly protein PilF
MERRLAAIMFTDIQGYTALMQHNEEKAIRTREKHRRIFNSITGKCKGKILQYYGDGTLSIFDSAIDAVQCAIEMQQGFQEDPIVPVRIGIHTGDIIISEEEVIGDGVNIASRIESLAVPGSVFISDKVYDEIKNQESIKTFRIKAFKLKNVDKPIDVYAISNEGLIVPKPEEVKGVSASGPTYKSAKRKHRKLKILIRSLIAITIISILTALLIVYLKLGTFKGTDLDDLEKSIAVLPFKYLSEDQSKQYIADGMLDAITGHLSTIEGLRVMPRTSVEQFRGTTIAAKEIGRELDVSFLIEGNFMIVDNQVSITIQLVIAEDEDQIYYNEYKRDYKDIIAVQSEVAQTIAREIEVVIAPEVRNRIEKIPTKNQLAYDLYLRGREAFHRFYLNRNSADLENCLQLFKQSIHADPEFALPYAWLGRAMEYQIGRQIFIDYKEDTIISLCNKALSLEPKLADGYWIRGRYFRNIGQFQNAIDDLTKAIQISPNNALACRYLGTTYFFNRDYLQAIINLKKAEKLVRGNELTQLYSDIGQLYISIGEFQKAEKYYKESISLQPNFIEGYRNLFWAELRQGKFEEAHVYAEQLLSLYPESTSSFSIMVESLTNLKRYQEAEEYYRKWEEKSEEKGEEAHFNRHRFAIVLWINGKKEEAGILFDKHIEVCANSIEGGGLYGKTLAPYDLAGINAFLGYRKAAYEWLTKYESEGFIFGLHDYISIDPLFENLWNDEEFKALTQRQEKKFSEIRAEIRQEERQIR